MYGRRTRVFGDRGAAAAEYAVIVSLIGVVVLGAVAVLGVQVFGLFADTEDAVAQAVEPASVSVPLNGTVALSSDGSLSGDVVAEDVCGSLPGNQPAGFDCSLPRFVPAVPITKSSSKVKYVCRDSVNYELVRGQKLEQNKMCRLTTAG